MRSKIFVLALMLSGLVASAENLKIPVVVLDADTEKPVSGVRIVLECRFRGHTSTGSKEFFDAILTDAKGQCEFEIEKVACEFSVCVKRVPPGYHKSQQIEKRVIKSKNLEGRIDFTVKPFLFYVYSKVNPAPLKDYKVTALNTWGFAWEQANNVLKLDMLKGAWLPPAGTGECADVVFTRLPHRDEKNPDSKDAHAVHYDEVRIEFPGECNGLYEIPESQRGEGCPIRVAPESGYMEKLVYSFPLEERRDEAEKNYCFRIRTETNDIGEVVSAYYAKSLKGLSFELEKYCKDIAGVTNRIYSLKFKYSLNPTPLDRNVE